MNDHTTPIGDQLEVEWNDDMVAIVEPDPNPLLAWRSLMIKLKPSTALNLLAWLRDEEATLIQLAERERG